MIARVRFVRQSQKLTEARRLQEQSGRSRSRFGDGKEPRPAPDEDEVRGWRGTAQQRSQRLWVSLRLSHA